MAKMTADTRLMRNRTSLRMLKLGGKRQTDRFQRQIPASKSREDIGVRGIRRIATLAETLVQALPAASRWPGKPGRLPSHSADFPATSAVRSADLTLECPSGATPD